MKQENEILMNKAVFLDRDGTINVEKNYLFKIEDFEFLPGVIEALKLFQENGYKLIIITNQSGIARGYYTEEDFHKLNDWMIDTLKKYGIYIDAVYYCPHHPDAINQEYRMDCQCRKPNIGLFIKAAEEFNIDLSKSIAIGDKIRDCSICSTTSCSGYLIGNNESTDIINAVKGKQYRDISYENDLLSVAQSRCY